MIVFEVENTNVNEKSGNKNGKDWKMRFQQVTISGHFVDGFSSNHPRETSIQLEDQAAPYAIGKYVISAEAFYFGDFGRFTMGRMKLQPLAQFMAEVKKQLAPAELKAA